MRVVSQKDVPEGDRYAERQRGEATIQIICHREILGGESQNNAQLGKQESILATWRAIGVWILTNALNIKDCILRIIIIPPIADRLLYSEPDRRPYEFYQEIKIRHLDGELLHDITRGYQRRGSEINHGLPYFTPK